MEKKLVLSTIVIFCILGSSHALSSNVSIGFQTNLETLLNLLAKTAPLHDGFYETSVGNNSDQVYGVAQCKANISSNACANCLNSTVTNSDRFWVESVSSFCTLKFSKENFFGDWINLTVVSFGLNGLDNSLAFSKGFLMMEGLAGKVADQPLMYLGAEVDVGDDGRRYGLAQCSRDLSKVKCRKCLEDGLVRYRSYVENRTGWEILGISCSLWYGNVSVTDQPVFPESTPSVVDTPTPPESPIPPSQLPPSQIPAAVTSVSQRCHGGSGIGTSLSFGTFTLIALMPVIYRG